MAYRYRKIKAEDGDIISPEDLNENTRQYAGEFNGFLDRDNFDEDAFCAKEVQKNAFNKIYVDSTGVSGSFSEFQLLGNKTIWETQDLNDVYVSKVEFEANTDGVLICEWHGNWEFNNAMTARESEGPAVEDPQVVSFRMLANGNVIAKSFRNIDSPAINCAAMFGCHQVPAGHVKVLVQARTYRIKGSEVVVANATTTDDRFCTVGIRELIVNYRKR